ncbi:SapB/AmfS family lanthipeptide [Kitasatospora sp. NPDC127067]
MEILEPQGPELPEADGGGQPTNLSLALCANSTVSLLVC